VYTHINLAIHALYVLGALNLIFVIAIYGIKLRNIRNHNIYEQFNRKGKDYLIYIQANLESDERLRVPPIRLKTMESNALQNRLNDMIESFTGDQRYKLIDLCEQLGFIRFHLGRLHGRSYRAKIDAAYHLGCMRVKEAVPALLELLRHHKYNSSLFVIARAIAKCSRDEKDVKEMVRILLTQGKSFPDLIVDMIEEAQIDQTALFAEFIHEDQPAVIQIGLNGLKEYTNPKIAAAVYRLMDSSNEDIQRKAIEIYLKSSIFLPRNVLNKLLGHPNAEIRLETVRALSEFKNTVYAGVMQLCLQDPDPRVIYASAKGLIHLGQDGMSSFCEAARDSRDMGQGTYMQEIIEEELRTLSTRLHALDNLTRYNALMYTYEKTFGKNKRMYRVV
jgi:hypothetical protein